ncbi:hypothetical protein RJ639_036446 [Escallonia herrerae]|uniref:Photosystem II 10 kDa polypeptide, chloroplastic n=1 Tax=Escallonia herrerae TaxID=1293975 RepID=A0AA88WSF3_9ASTE|nr:hypothetical protein RJ639_036446 [Escallonia herrerae]
MATSVMTSLSLKPSPFTLEKTAVRGLPSLAKTSSFKVQASGTGGGMDLRDGKDASGRKPKGKGVYQFVDKYGANVDGYRSGGYLIWEEPRFVSSLTQPIRVKERSKEGKMANTTTQADYGRIYSGNVMRKPAFPI